MLDGPNGARLVLLSAPAGYGKSALLAEWLLSSGSRHAWLALEPGDSDPGRFLRYLRGAAIALRSAATNARVPRDPAGAPDDEIVLADLVSALEGQPAPTTIVLDDYHVITSPVVHRIVAAVIHRLPPNARVAIATRADPPLPLARLRAGGELIEIRAESLRFTRDEAEAFLAGPMNCRLPAELIDILVERTEGWAAALQLAALSLRGRDDVNRVVRDFGASNRFLLDYVLEEVLANQPDETAAFLLQTSILNRLTADLCDTVADRNDSAALLDLLERSNMLTFPLDAERRWYRYHHLFAQLLRARLSISDAKLPPVLHARAADWFETNGLLEDAIEHALLAQDSDRARGLIRRHWTTVMHAGELWTVQRWLDALPAEVVRADPQLSATYAFGHVLRGETEGVGSRLDDARAALAAGGIEPADRVLVPPQLELIEAKAAELRHDPVSEIAHVRAALELIPTNLDPSVEALLRGDALNLLGQAHLLAGDDAAAAEAFSEALPLLRATGNGIAVAHGGRDLARIELRRGNARGALRLCESLLPTDGDDDPAAAALHLSRAEALIALGRLAPARRAAVRAEELARDSGDGAVARDAVALLQRLPPVSGEAEATRGPSPMNGLAEGLTPRETEVFRLVAAGLTNREIGDELFVTVGTVKAHVHAICAKLGASTRVQAIVRGRALRLLD